MSKRIEYLESMRGIAAISVVSFHALASFILFYKANYNQDYENVFMRFLVESPLKLVWGGIGVLLFFVLSGYVLTNLFSKPQRISYSEYMGKRFLRIYVPYIVIMALSVVLTIIFLNMKSPIPMSPLYEQRWHHIPTWESILAYIFMFNYDMSNVNGVVWTLYHEMRISIIFPIIAFIVLKLNYKNSVIISLFFSIGLMRVCYLIGSFFNDTVLRSFFIMSGDTFFYSFFFFIGAFLFKYKENIIAFTVNRGKAFIPLLIVISLLLIANKWMYNFINIGAFRLQDLIAGIGIFLLFMAIMSSPSLEKRLTVKPLKWLGEISYSIYLTHIPVIMVTTTLLSPIIGMWFSMGLALLLVIPISNIFHKIVVVPSIRWSKGFSNLLKERKNKKRAHEATNSQVSKTS